MIENIISTKRDRLYSEPDKMNTSGVLSGMFISFGAIFMCVLKADGYSKLVCSIAFSIGLILVIVCKTELFTGNCLIAGLTQTDSFVTKLLIQNYISNFMGALLCVCMIDLAGVNVDEVATIAKAKCDMPIIEMLVRGALCNILVCLAVWMANYTESSKSTTSKILAIIFPITMFVFCGFEHSVANMFFLTIGVMHGTISIIQMIFQLCIVTIGNFLGGIFIGILLGDI